MKLFSSQAQAVRVMMRTVRVSECELRSPDDGTPAPGLTWREQRGERESSPVQFGAGPQCMRLTVCFTVLHLSQHKWFYVGRCRL